MSLFIIQKKNNTWLFSFETTIKKYLYDFNSLEETSLL